ncbi:MAG: DUF3617 domain-containing protein [Pseudomonas sp.]|uniref:DUF3617 domain-containing protein n=1 Tax=Pseudomonas sp. TaxID=306 RepID=UPI003D0DCC59
MRASLWITLLMSAGLMPVAAVAQPILPGLWEIRSTNMQMDGQALPDMDVMLNNLPPAQRQIMEQMMAKQGVQLGGQGVQLCLSKEQVESQEIPLQDPQSGCTQEITERTDTTWTFRFSCPQAKGQGETRFLNDKAFVTQVNGTFVSAAGEQSGSMESHATWIGADCGGLQPRQ